MARDASTGRGTLDNWPPDEDTDPEVFASKSADVTARVLVCPCGRTHELPAEPGAYLRGAQAVLDAVRELLVDAGERPEGIANIVHSIAVKIGIEVL